MKKIITAAAMLGALSIGAATASANTGAGAAFDAHFVNNSTCTTCHSGTPGTLYQIGTDWKANGGTSMAGLSTQAGWDAFDVKYAATYGGVDPAWVFVAPGGGTDVPDVGGSSGGCIASSATTPLMMVLAMLSLGFFVRRKKS